jgi:hypothetical protein
MRYAAERRNLDDSIAELRKIAGGRDDILAEAAGIEAGAWYAWPSTHAGYDLVAAGMLIMVAGHEGKPLDYDELQRWTRVGDERGMRSRRAGGDIDNSFGSACERDVDLGVTLRKLGHEVIDGHFAYQLTVP